jgi:hypothetical protein
MPKQKIKNKSATDKFYTKPEVSLACIQFVRSLITDPVLFVEPSAGSGSFSSQIDCMAFDIAPEASGITKANFLELSQIQSSGPICMIGNPPFGNRNVLTNAFIQHSMDVIGAKYIAFILPMVYRKFTMQNVFPTDWSLIGSMHLPENSFTLNGSDYHVPCLFQVWEKGSNRPNLREPEQTWICSDFSFVDRASSDWFVFGAAPTKIIRPGDVQPTNRGYFLKANIPEAELYDRILAVDWKSAASSSINGGASWFPKGEFVKHYTLKHGV